MVIPTHAVQVVHVLLESQHSNQPEAILDQQLLVLVEQVEDFLALMQMKQPGLL